MRSLIMNTFKQYFIDTQNNMQLLTIEFLNVMKYSMENTNIDRGDNRGQYWYLDITFNDSTVNYCFIL